MEIIFPVALTYLISIDSLLLESRKRFALVSPTSLTVTGTWKVLINVC